jgi:2'-hydroxyisoflavone reductase
MDLLVIGGGRFVGRAIVLAALAAGHRVSTFSRGQQPVPAGVQALHGDRRQDLSALGGGRWDAVIDCCGYLPGEVAAVARALAGRCPRYVFVSSVSVYADHARPRTEEDPLSELADPADETFSPERYGALKAGCEAALRTHWPGTFLCLRPTLVVGPNDPTGRFSWWPARAAAGGPMLWPGRPQAPLQWVDARDLAAFALRAAAQAWQGALNVGSPAGQWCWGDLAQACAEATDAAFTPVWLPQAALLAAGVQPWSELPLWLPEGEGPHAAFLQVDCRRAQALGLVCRAPRRTVADTLDWWRGLPPAQQRFEATGLSPEREQALLA